MTDAKTKAAFAAVQAVAEAIKALGSVPSGHLYAQVMCHMSLQNYEAIIEFLVQNRLVRKQAHLLTWIG